MPRSELETVWRGLSKSPGHNKQWMSGEENTSGKFYTDEGNRRTFDFTSEVTKINLFGGKRPAHRYAGEKSRRDYRSCKSPTDPLGCKTTNSKRYNKVAELW